MTKNKIFISHSTKDIEIVKSFVEDILILGLEIPAERIFCSGIEGQGLKSGKYIPDQLREEINASSLALLFISKNYRTSEICLNEIGAAWATMDKDSIIPILLPDTKFTELGILDLNRIGIKVNESKDILKLVHDCKEHLNPSFNIQRLDSKLKQFVNKTHLLEPDIPPMEIDEDQNDPRICYDKYLFAMDKLIRKNIPVYNDGIYQIKDEKTKNKILTDLSNAPFLKRLWYKMAEGDSYIEKLQKLPSGNWLIAEHWEIKITDLWVSMDSEPQYGFILVHTEKQDPFKINSDIGGESYYVGVLKDGTIVSENEYLNGWAIIGGDTINVDNLGVEIRHRDRTPHWIFFVSSYHKAGYHADETIEFCRKLDNGEIEVNQENIRKYLRSLTNHPTVSAWR